MSRPARTWLAVAAAVLAVAVAVALAGGGDGGPATMDDRVNEVASELRCPVCQNLSVADSPSRLAGEMRAEIGSQLEAGRTPEQVRDFFVERYGEWVLLAPERRGLNLLPWTLPLASLIVGAGVWVVAVRRRSAPSEEPA